jgi:hypothetical protein
MFKQDTWTDSWRFSFCITASIHCRSVSLFKILHFYIKEIDRKMPTLGAGTTRFWKTSSLRINHKLQATPLKRKSNLLECLLELTLQDLKISSGQDGGPGHAITSLTTHQQNLAIAHSKKICFVDSWMPHSLHSIGPDQYIFFNCSADWILSCMTCQRKIFIFKGTLVFHIHNIHLSENPVNVSSLYKEEVVNFPYL